MPQGFEKSIAIVLVLAGCAAPAPKAALLPDASCRLPKVTWAPEDTSQTIKEVRELAAARAKLCGWKR